MAEDEEKKGIDKTIKNIARTEKIQIDNIQEEENHETACRKLDDDFFQQRYDESH